MFMLTKGPRIAFMSLKTMFPHKKKKTEKKKSKNRERFSSLVTPIVKHGGGCIML